MSVTVEITERDGEYTAVDTETGVMGVGETRATALASLAVQLETEEYQTVSETDSKAILSALTARTQQRFEDEGVTEDDIDEAIEWARSQ